jgi:hypothetical protein|tara:strand:- start:616 stop:726 length:111 start_codon:yes stop_codon:yes gene_type:complete
VVAVVVDTHKVAVVVLVEWLFILDHLLFLLQQMQLS